MNLNPITPEDPRLTAYALGELDIEESADIASAIAGDPAAQAAVEEIRSLAGRLEEALADEPVEASLSVPVDSAADLGEDRKVIHFPVYWVAGLAAACFAVLLALRPASAPHSEGALARGPGVALPGAKPSDSLASVSDQPVAPSLDAPGLPLLGTDDSPKDELAPSAAGVIPDSSSLASTSSPDASLPLTTPLRPTAVDRSGPWTSTERGSAVAFGTSRDRQSRNRQLSPLMGYGTDRGTASHTQGYAYQPAQGFLGVAGYPLSSFSAAVGTGSYANVRRFLRNGRLPPPDAVRVEEMLNYFSYGSVGPRDANPLAASLEVAAAPWNPSHRLVRIGLKGRDLSELERVTESRQLAESTTNENLVAVAKDVKLQVEFNPEQAKSYRLIGYEDTSVQKQDAAGTKLPGSEMPAGHMITALYEVVPIGAPDFAGIEGDPLRYSGSETRVASSDDPRHRELLTLRVHYKLPTVEVSQKMEVPLVDTGADFSVASNDFKFAAAVAGFGMLLTESPHKGTVTYDKVLTWAQEGQDKEDASGKRREFIDLVKKAKGAAVE